MRAIVAGETDPAKLSELGGPRLAATPAHLAIRGSMAPARSEPQGLTPSVTPWSQWTSRICFPLIYSRSVPARSGCARCPLASPEPRHDAGQVTHSTVRPAYKHPSATLPSPSAAPGPRSNRYRPSAPLLLHLTRFRPLALFVRLRPARVDGVVMQASETYTGPDLSLCSILVAEVSNRARSRGYHPRDRLRSLAPIGRAAPLGP